MRSGKIAAVILPLMIFAALNAFAPEAFTADGVAGYEFSAGDLSVSFSRWTIFPFVYAVNFPLTALALAALMLAGSLICGRMTADMLKQRKKDSGFNK